MIHVSGLNWGKKWLKKAVCFAFKPRFISFENERIFSLFLNCDAYGVQIGVQFILQKIISQADWIIPFLFQNE